MEGKGWRGEVRECKVAGGERERERERGGGGKFKGGTPFSACFHERKTNSVNTCRLVYIDNNDVCKNINDSEYLLYWPNG